MHVVDAVLFIKRFLAHAPDGELSMPEWDMILRELRQDMEPQAGTWRGVIARVESQYEALSRRPGAAVAHFRKCVDYIGTALPQPRRIRLLCQLWRLARADGTVDAMERLFLQQIEQAWCMRPATSPV